MLPFIGGGSQILPIFQVGHPDVVEILFIKNPENSLNQAMDHIKRFFEKRKEVI